jgi:hypothetical protein
MWSQLSPRSLLALQRERQAIEMRIQGKSFQEIADALNYRHRGSAWLAVRRAKVARLIELAELVQRLERVKITRDLAAVEQRAKALQSGKGSRSG